MLQFSTTLYSVTGRIISRSNWRCTALFSISTSVTSDAAKAATKQEEDRVLSTKLKPEKSNNSLIDKLREDRTHNHTLSKESEKCNDSDHDLAEKIAATKSVNELLNFVKIPNISEDNILKIMCSVTSLINQGNVEVPNIQRDKRFIKMQSILRNMEAISARNVMSDAKYEALAQLSIPRMIQEMTKLGTKRNRDLPMLKFFSQNIIEYADVLSARTCGSLLYSMATLSFPDEALLQKICSDLQHNREEIHGGIYNGLITSLGMLRYKNEELLNFLCDLVLENAVLLKPENMHSIALTFATLGYNTEKANAVIEKYVVPVSLNSIPIYDRISFVWSLAILGKANKSHFSAILDSDFIKNQFTPQLGVAKQLKLLNVNAAAQYLQKHYSGPFLEENSSVFKATVTNSKQKQSLLDVLVDTLNNMLPSKSHFAVGVNTKMGFAIDAVCCLDSRFHYVTVDDSTESDNTIRIAMVLSNYSDYCRGKRDPVGIVDFQRRLLDAQGYHTILISYEHLSKEDKLVKRLKYISECINSVKQQLST